MVNSKKIYVVGSTETNCATSSQQEFARTARCTRHPNVPTPINGPSEAYSEPSLTV